MLEVVLKDVLFYSNHGVHAEEALTGGAFVVNLIVAYHPTKIPVIDLGETIDYTVLYKILEKRMKDKTALLETIATEIASEIIERFDLAEKVNISIDKLNAPIPNFQGVVGVAYELNRNNK